MKDVLIISHYIEVPGEVGNSRFSYIANNLDINKVTVEVITTTFSHILKKQRITNEEKSNYTITKLYEPGYNNNVSLKRFYSHYIFGKNLKKYLKSRVTPDLIYCAIPSLNAGIVAAKFAKKNNIRFIIDIQDLWPEAFKMIFNVPLISNLIYYPMRKQADYIYKSSSVIFAVSKTYAEAVNKRNMIFKPTFEVFLGTDLSNFDYFANLNKVKNKPTDEIWLAYIGTLGHSYDIECVIDALEIINKTTNFIVKFIVMGDGPLKLKFMEYSNKKNIDTLYTGRLEYNEMVGILTSCDISVNPIKRGSAGSIINKVGDYAAASLPVLNTQESVEYRELVNQYQIGINCINGDSVDLAKNMLILIKNKAFREQLGKNNRVFAQEKFDRKTTYKRILQTIEENI